MTHVLITLGDPSWRGISFPYTKRDYGFAHESASHRYIFRDQELIESLGRKNPSYRFEIPFYDSLRMHGKEALFRRVYPRFLAACLDRSRGELHDPLHGTVEAKCASLQETAESGRLDGVSVTAEFIFAPRDESDQDTNLSDIASSLPQLEEQAVKYDQKSKGMTAEQRAYFTGYNKVVQAPPKSALESIQAAAGSVQRAKGKIIANVSGIVDDLEKTREDLEDAADPQLEEFRREAGRLSLGIQAAANGPLGAKIVMTQQTIGRVAFAVQQGVELKDLLDMNPQLANMLLIPSGFKVRLPSGR